MSDTARVALVTGGGRGIGLGIATALARDGWQLVICGVREPSAVQPTLEGLSRLTEVHYVQADISSASDREGLFDAAIDRFDGVQLLVNNAGISVRERVDLLEATQESFEQVMAVNLRGPYFLTQRVARHFVEQRAGGFDGALSVIFISSVSATVASTNRGEYCVSKAGLAMTSKLFSVRLAQEGIPVYEIRPGLIETDMTAVAKAKYDAMIEEGLLLEPRWGKPEDIGRAVVMLARGDLPYATGQVLTLDGGLTAARL